MSATVLRKGWCPGALRPMPAGDGLLVRLKLTAGELAASSAVAIAELAGEHGNGSIDLTRRANLQIRGVREASLPELTRALQSLGLIDDSLEAEAIRNVMVSPLAGFDLSCTDGRDMARALEDRLRQDKRLHGLSAKFGFGIDGGGIWPLDATNMDIGLRAADDRGSWTVQLAGSELSSAPIAGGQAVATLMRLAAAAIESGLPRMRELVARDGGHAVLARAGVAMATVERPPNNPTPAAAGRLALSPDLLVAAIGLPFGRIEASQLARLGEATGQGMTLRLTPWRLLLVPCRDTVGATTVLELAAKLDLVTTAADPRAQIAACTGAPACPNGTTPTREDALRVYERIAARGSTPSPRLHVSGCAKSCAHSGFAGVTLIARDGRYDLVLNGTAADPPALTSIDRRNLAAAIAKLDERS